jgi:hypothetical protein
MPTIKHKGSVHKFPKGTTGADIQKVLENLDKQEKNEKEQAQYPLHLLGLLSAVLKKLETLDDDKVVNAIKESKVEQPDYSNELLQLGEKLDSLNQLASKETPVQSNTELIAAIKELGKQLKPTKIKPEPKITGFRIPKRDRLGKIKDVELIYDSTRN